jgi:hypothetical protein
VFTCANCRKEKPDSEEGSMGWVAKIGFLLVSKTIWYPSRTCQWCVTQVSVFGLVCFFIAAAVVIAAFFR